MRWILGENDKTADFGFCPSS